MLSYQEHFASKRPDGRHVSTMAAQMEMLRHIRQKLALPDDITPEALPAWRTALTEKLRELLNMPEPTPQPAPVFLSSVQRDGYRTEKWEFYPDDYTAVPFLILIPDGASAANPVPGVMCYLGSNYSKEFCAGEPVISHPNAGIGSFPERNRMAPFLAGNGMAAFVFDNPGIGECSVLTDPAYGETQWETRTQMTHGYLELGQSYVGVTTFQKMRFLEWLDCFPFIDQSRLGIASHSLGTEPAICLGLMDERIKAIVFNDFMHNDLRRYVSITEEPEDRMMQNVGNWHIVPGQYAWFGFPEMCAAFAPRYLALTEGGADESLDIVRRAYALAGAEDCLQISYYPAFSDPASRTVHGKIPDHGLSMDDFYRRYSYVLTEDHSFRQEPALRLLSKAFGL